MSRAARLLDLIQYLRRHRYPVAGQAIAAELGVSLRTVYRDIDTLRSQGAPIDGEAGMGYVLKPGFVLPPLMFSQEEIAALVLGSRWVAQRTDGGLAAAARNALARIGAVLPAELRSELDATALIIGPGKPVAVDDHVSVILRAAIRDERRLAMRYSDAGSRASERTVWPIALAYFEEVRVLVAWCELRQAYRHFRADRIQAPRLLEGRYPRRRHVLVREWQRETGITLP